MFKEAHLLQNFFGEYFLQFCNFYNLPFNLPR